jgi:ABC-2 type transport system permease protein
MSTTSTAIARLSLRPPNLVAISIKEAKYEFLKNLRYPAYSISTVVLPLMFYVLFGLVMGRGTIGNLQSSVYLIPTYGSFGVMGASLFGTAAGLASDRGFGWLQVKRASPMPVFAYFFAKIAMSLIFCAVDVLALLALGIAFGGVHIAPLTASKLVLTLLAGSLPFCAMGLAIGYFATPNSAPALINLFYLPMSFFSGLWVPFIFLPHVVQEIAVFLPPYHLAQLALNLVGYGQSPAADHWKVLFGFMLICLGIAWVGHQRDQKANS